MKRSIKFVLCLLLTLSLFIPNTVVFAADLDDHNSNNSNKVNLEVINADLTESIAVIEEELGENGTNVEAELNKLIQEFENTMNEKTDTEEIEKLQQLIATTNELLNEYDNYCLWQNKSAANGKIKIHQ